MSLCESCVFGNTCAVSTLKDFGITVACHNYKYVEMISVRKQDYESLLEDSKILRALEHAGVDNWEGYEIAMEKLED